MNNIKRIEIYSESGKADGTVKYINVIYEDDTNKRIDDFNEIGETFSRFVFQNSGKSMSDLLDDKDKIQVMKIVELVDGNHVIDELEHEQVEKIEKQDENIEQEEQHEEKKKKGSLKTKVLSISCLALAGALVWSLLHKDNNGFSLQCAPYPKKTGKTTEQGVDSERLVVPATKISHTEPVEYNGSQYINNLEAGINSGATDNALTRLLILDEMSAKELLNNLEYVNDLLATNMNEVCNLMSGGKMVGDEYILTVSDYYNPETKDYAILQEFCGLRNIMVHNAYNQESEITRQQIGTFLDRYLDFAFNGLPVNGIYWDEINPMTKYITTFLCKQILGPKTNYSHEVQGKEMNRKDLQQYVYDFLVTNVTNNLEQNVRRC